jgi:two-component system, cell cycle response regulator
VTNPSRFEELKTTGKLPSPAGVALAVVELCRRDGTSIDEIAHAVRADPALSGRIIKFANSAAQGARRPVVSIPEAIRMVGVNTVCQLVLGFSLLGQYRKGACQPFDYGRFWSRSLAMGIGASALAARVRCTPADEAFTCGLLAGVGTLALATIDPQEFGELLALPERGPAFAARERERFATDHNELSAALLEDWHLPRLFVSAVFHHEDPSAAQLPENSRQYMVCAVLGMGAQIADFCVARDDERHRLTPDLILSAAKLGIDEETLCSLTNESVAQWREWGKILEVQTQDVPAFETVMADKPDPAPPLEVSTTAAAIQPLSILAIDDDRSTLLVLEHLLRGLGHTVYTAQDGKTGLARAISIRPQIIISDWIMPGIDGLALCKALRQTEEGQQMYFIVLSALEQDDQLVEAFESGVDDYLTKPFTPRVLAARLRAGLRVIRLQEEARRDSENLRKFAAELAVANRRLQQAALTDPLTGLPNRRYAMERLDQEWAAALRSNRPLSCMVLDLDRFKQINDTHGHDIGDLVLRQASAVLRKEARTEDGLCRIGGEEFLVICADTPLAAAVQLGQRLCTAIARTKFSNGAVTCTSTVSVGVAQRAPEMQRADELFKAADNALYAAKAAGRNRVIAYQPPAPPKT